MANKPISLRADVNSGHPKGANKSRALKIRIEFGAILYYKQNKEPPKPYSECKGPYIIHGRHARSEEERCSAIGGLCGNTEDVVDVNMLAFSELHGSCHGVTSQENRIPLD